MPSSATILYVYRDSYHHYKELDYKILSGRFDVIRFPYRYTPACLSELAKRVRQCDAAVMWFASPMAFAVTSLAKAFRKKSIIIAGGYDVADYAPLKHGMAHRPVQKHFARSALQLADHVLPVSRFTEEELLRFARPRRHTVVYNAVDLPSEVPERPRKPRVVTIGAVDAHYSELKGHVSFAAVARRVPELDFVLVGPQRGDFAERFRREAPANLRFIGYLPHDQLLDFLAESAVYMQLSFYESFGLAVAEAMWCGCTPIVSDLAALPEVVGTAGHVVSPTDHAGIAELLRRVMAQPLETNRSAQAQARRFSVEERERELLRIVDEELVRHSH